jgi:hypothetical protein
VDMAVNSWIAMEQMQQRFMQCCLSCSRQGQDKDSSGAKDSTHVTLCSLGLQPVTIWH